MKVRAIVALVTLAQLSAVAAGWWGLVPGR